MIVLKYFKVSCHLKNLERDDIFLGCYDKAERHNLIAKKSRELTHPASKYFML